MARRSLWPPGRARRWIGAACPPPRKALGSNRGRGGCARWEMGRRSSDTEEESRSRRKKKHRRRSSSSSSSDSRTYSRKKSGRKSRSRSRARQRSYSRSSERSGHRRTHSGSRERRKGHNKDKGKGKDKEAHGTKAGDSANIKAGLEHLGILVSPAHQVSVADGSFGRAGVGIPTIPLAQQQPGPWKSSQLLQELWIRFISDIQDLENEFPKLQNATENSRQVLFPVQSRKLPNFSDASRNNQLLNRVTNRTPAEQAKARLQLVLEAAATRRRRRKEEEEEEKEKEEEEKRRGRRRKGEGEEKEEEKEREGEEKEKKRKEEKKRRRKGEEGEEKKRKKEEKMRKKKDGHNPMPSKADEALKAKERSEEEAKRRKEEDQATLLDQVKRVKEIEAIESDAFVPQTFRSSKEVKKSAEPPELQHEPVTVGAGAEAAAPEKEPPAANIPTAIKYQDDNSLAHPNLFVEKAEAEEKWFQRLVALRQERLMGSPVA
ncbi:hypothetical protein DUI87_21062 [Hirundo rustica rustica]|uniref:Serine/Arginine-related protein 53 n=1 Tax=Hirundo rustica rustica TaxID=333673 RepID=A0A3M0JNP9_HIRRU|nr:hypothetical protein DUI87_21062 [Hirundo rustica rustica]